jgi:hypothetical protein
MLKWKKVGRGQYESENKKEKLDFVIDTRDGTIVLIVFDSKIKDQNEAHIEDIAVKDFTEAKKEAEKYKRK